MNTDLQKTYNRIAEDWGENHADDDWWVEGTNLFLNNLPGGALVLDVGCGGGVKAEYVANRGFKVVGIDFSEGQIALATKRAPDVDFRLLAMENLDEVPEMFDGVFAQASLLHIPKKQVPEILAKMIARTKPGGQVYVAVKEVRPDRAEEEIRKEETYGYEYERFFSYFTLSELEQMFLEAQLEIIHKDRLPSGRAVWLQIIGKK